MMYLVFWTQAEKPKLNFKDEYPEWYRNSHPTAPLVVPWASGVVSTWDKQSKLTWSNRVQTYLVDCRHSKLALTCFVDCTVCSSCLCLYHQWLRWGSKSSPLWSFTYLRLGFCLIAKDFSLKKTSPRLRWGELGLFVLFLR